MCVGPFVDVYANAIIALFTVILTISTVAMWLETRRMASGGEDHAAKMERSIGESAKAATAMQGVADGMALAARAMKDMAYQAELSNIENRETTQKQFKRMDASIAAAQTAANAAKQSADAYRAVERAWIHSDEVRHTRRTGMVFRKPFDGYQVSIIWKNAGHSNALKVSVLTDYKTTLSGQYDIAALKFRPPSVEKENEIAVGPGVAISGPSCFIPFDVFERMRKGEMQILIWGYCSYADIFGEERHTEVCFISNYGGKGVDGNGNAIEQILWMNFESQNSST